MMGGTWNVHLYKQDFIWATLFSHCAWPWNFKSFNESNPFWTNQKLVNHCIMHDEKWMIPNQSVPSWLNVFLFLQPRVTDRLKSAAGKRIAWTDLIPSHSPASAPHWSTCTGFGTADPPGQCLLTPNHSSGLQFDSSKWTRDIQCQTFIFTIKCYLRGTRVSPVRINPKWLS